MDYREYYEVNPYRRNWDLSLFELKIPILLFSALCCAFWLSFAGIGASYVSPTIWPLIWLAVTAAILFDPLPLLFRSSRLWFLRIIGKLLVSGIRTVEVCCISLRETWSEQTRPFLVRRFLDGVSLLCTVDYAR